MAVIPAGALVFTGYGNSSGAPGLRFVNASTGAAYPDPASAPVPGSGVDGITVLRSSHCFCIIGGGSPNFNNTGMGVFNADGTVRTDVAQPGALGATGGFGTVSDGNDYFYDDGDSLLSGSFRSVVSRFDKDGGYQGSTDVSVAGGSWSGISVTGFDGFAPSWDGTSVFGIFKITESPSRYRQVRKWTWGGSVVGTVISKAKDTYYLANNNAFCVLPDGSLLIAWASAVGTGIAERYDTSGSLLATYSLPSTGDAFPVAVCPGLTSSTFWVNYQDSGTADIAILVEVAISGGAILNTLLPSDGSYQYNSAMAVVLEVIGATPVVVLPVPSSTPAAPQTPCAPQTQVGNGGIGNAGCNTGGVGWTRSYTGPYGAAPSHADPDPGEILSDLPTGTPVELWMELVHVDYPSSVVTTYRRAQVPLDDDPTFEGGYKPDGLITVASVRHALGNEQGGIEAARATVEISDVRNGLLRPLLDTQELEGKDLYLKLASDAIRRTA